MLSVKEKVHAKLMGLLQRAPYIGCEDVHRQYAVNWLMNNGVTVQDDKDTNVPSKWISVKDRLPDTAERVLVCKTWLGRVYKPEYGYYQDFPNQKGCWYVLTEEGYFPQREVTHWMPLPQHPKGE
jgi:hypothetical protein